METIKKPATVYVCSFADNRCRHLYNMHEQLAAAGIEIAVEYLAERENLVFVDNDGYIDQTKQDIAA